MKQITLTTTTIQITRIRGYNNPYTCKYKRTPRNLDRLFSVIRYAFMETVVSK